MFLRWCLFSLTLVRMAPANNNAKVKAEAEAKLKAAEAEREVLRNKARINAAAKLEVERLRKKNENEKKKLTMKPLTRNTLLRNLANLKEPALDPLRDAIMSLSDPSFLNKKFNADVYRGLPLRVKDFIGLSANQVTRAVIINKIIEAVKVGRERNAKAKNARENMKLAQTLVKAVNGLNNNKQGAATMDRRIIRPNAKKPNATTKTETNRAWSIKKKTPATTPTGKNNGKGTPKPSGTPMAATTPTGKNNGKGTPKPSGTPVAATTPTGKNNGKGTPKPMPLPENNGLEVIDAVILPPSQENQPVVINANAKQLQLTLPNTNQKIVINANAKQLQLTLPNNIKPKNVINSTVKLLRGIPIKNSQLNSFVLALEQSPNNKNVVNVSNPNTPDPETMARIFENYIYGNPISRPEIIYLENGLFKIAEGVKKNSKPLALTWETQTNAKTKSGKNVSLQDWIGAVTKSNETGSTKSKPKGVIKGLFVGLTAAAVRAIITSRRATTNPVMFNNPLSKNQQGMIDNPLAE